MLQRAKNTIAEWVSAINTAIPYGIVRVGDGYGTVTEDSITKMIRNNPDDLSEAADHYINMLKSIHAINVDDGELPDMKKTALDWAEFVESHIPKEQGDYHTGNVMVQNGEPLLIDMDTLCVGHPIFELGSMFNAFVGYSEINHQNVMDFFGYSFEVAEKL